MRLTTLLIATLLGSTGCSSTGGDDGDAEFIRDGCRQDCGNINFFGECVTPTQQTECQDACLSRTTSDAESFSDCFTSNRGGVGGSTGEYACNEAECLSILGVGEGSGTNNAANNNAQTADPTADCKTNCDVVNTDCPEQATASVTSECKAKCEAQGNDAVTSFNTCVPANRYICDELTPCLDHLGVQHL